MSLNIPVEKPVDWTLEIIPMKINGGVFNRHVQLWMVQWQEPGDFLHYF
jgi:hypothetical protein